MKASVYTVRSGRLLFMGITAALLAAGCGSTTTSSSSSSSGGSSSTASSTAAGSSSGGGGYDLPSSVKTLTIDNEAGSVRLTASQSSSQIHVVERPTGGASSTHNVAGSDATIASKCPSGINLSDCHLDYQVTMPSSVALTVKGTAGQVSLQGALANANIQTTAGEVSGSALGRGSYMVATSAGKVNLSFAAPPMLVKATTNAGEITITVPGNAHYRVKTSTTVGESNVAVPNDPAAANTIDVSATVGSISVRTG